MENNEFKDLVERYKQKMINTYNVDNSNVPSNDINKIKQSVEPQQMLNYDLNSKSDNTPFNSTTNEVENIQPSKSDQNITNSNLNVVNTRQQDNLNNLSSSRSNENLEVANNTDLNILNPRTKSLNEPESLNNKNTLSDQTLFTGNTSTSNESYIDFLGKNTNSGILKIQASVARQTMPVENVAIVISKDFKDGRKIFYNVKTDQNGIVDNLLLPAPSRDLSMKPSQALPFATYDIVASHPNYQQAMFTSIPIFDGIKSIQPINLLPL